MQYELWYMVLSVCSVVLFSCSVFNFGPLEHLSPVQSTGLVIASFTALTLVRARRSR